MVALKVLGLNRFLIAAGKHVEALDSLLIVRKMGRTYM
jgi:hypothetical protein